MYCDALFAVIEKLSGEYIQMLRDVCAIESPTEYKEGVDRVGKYLADKAAEKGWLVEIQPQKISGDVVCITMNPDAKEAPVCFSGHMDTVHPVGSFGETPVLEDAEKIYAPGVTDCKGGIVASFFAMDALARIGFTDRPVKLILQSDEENGSRNSDKSTVQFMYEKAKDCIAFLNTEPGDADGHIVERKGICKFRFEITGKSVHSSRCDAGASAIAEAARKILLLEKYKDSAAITCNCGLIRGGSAENTVPEFCTFTADFRYRTGEERQEILRVAEEIAATPGIPGTHCTYTLVSYRCPMEKTEKNITLFQKAKEIFCRNGLSDIQMLAGSGGSDASDLTERGIPCMESFGVLGGNIHRRDEFAYIDSLARAAKKLAAVAYCIE